MLKITTETEDNNVVRVNLHGHFTAEYVPEVKKTLSTNGYKSGKVILDLRNVSFVDRLAMEFLRGTKFTRVKIKNTPSYVTRWIEQER
jgi:anti-anti-sigma regulatory factor